MTHETVRRYRAAHRERDRRAEAVLRRIGTIQQAARMLEHWQTVEVANVGLGFPKEISMLGRTIDATAWPNAPELAEALVAWHEANQTVLDAWNALEPAERRALPPPAD